MLPIAFVNGLPIGRGMWVEHTDIEKRPLKSSSPKPLTAMAPSVVMAVRHDINSPAGQAQRAHPCRLLSTK